MVAQEKIVPQSGVSTISGTPDQVRTGLRGMRAEHVVALALDHGNEAEAQALVEVVTHLAPLVSNIVQHRQEQRLTSIIDALVPDMPLPMHKIAEARMIGEARRAVLESGDWLTAVQIAEMAGLSATNPSAQPNKWKKDGQIFAIRHRGVDYFPGYALDPASEYRPVKGLAKVLGALRGIKDDWGLAYWFGAANSFLGGRRPQDLLAGQPARVLAAAEDEITGPVHG